MADSAVGVVDESDALGKEMAKVDLSAAMVVRVLEGAAVLGVILVVLVVLLSRPLWKESPQRPQFGGMHSPQGILLRNTCESIKDSLGLNVPLESRVWTQSLAQQALCQLLRGGKRETCQRRRSTSSIICCPPIL